MTSLHRLLGGFSFHPFDDIGGDVLTCFAVLVKIRIIDGDAYWLTTSEAAVSDELVLGLVIVQIGLLRRELGIIPMDADQSGHGDTITGTDVRVPVEQVFPDVELTMPPLDTDERIEFALVLAALRDAEGKDVGWSYRTSEAPNMEELLGALEVLRAELTRELHDSWNS